MGKYRFYYNPETCQYERVRVTVGKVFRYSAGVVAMGSLVLAGLLFLSFRFTETDLERSLQRENKALEKHQQILVTQLSVIDVSLANLKEKDNSIHTRLFEEENTPADTTSSAVDKKAILLADGPVFSELINHLSTSSDRLFKRAVKVNKTFNRQFTWSEKDMERLTSVPTLLPIPDLNPDFLISGFGFRINPFHKGRYLHQGVDLNAARGTEVIAAGPGKVIEADHSSLQAGYGNYIEIDHGYGFTTRYAHLEDIYVKSGQKITSGMVIGTVGSSGGSVAPHLHYEVLQNGENLDPVIYMIKGLTSYQYNQLATLCKKSNQSLD